jgi:hypothetical protein
MKGMCPPYVLLAWKISVLPCFYLRIPALGLLIYITAFYSTTTRYKAPRDLIGDVEKGFCCGLVQI